MFAVSCLFIAKIFNGNRTCMFVYLLSIKVIAVAVGKLVHGNSNLPEEIQYAHLQEVLFYADTMHECIIPIRH